MIVKSATFVKSAVTPAHYPPADRPEVAFAGRSNVGKSSLINRLVNRRRLVKTSSTPGRTQLINFFLVNQNLYFVDLPGYGYAKVPAKVQRTWAPMVEAYLGARPTLQAVVVIIDIRRLPGREEHDLLARLRQQHVATLPVLSKADKLPRMHQLTRQRTIAESLGLAPADLILFSAKSGQGRRELWQAIERRIGLDDAPSSDHPRRSGGE
ncbi:MAG TPA: YihA family ribosome biogenesis GTP-binding protein [Desulfobacteraceae bacterium]|nr:YihA family ribosome biogenesis GTP-binding protein [Deltaproteobacteria bacterium]MBW2356916.1 YihA family ribosome biogenesis GTP-binding protein [Deltaproteobacteria bacterium]RLB95965.1 MAG: YihA family ribosome biogenesis GTP-binding protein [Deltaproteobacteria bacterium]HDI58911.1 YihA family ribosome biogenesis GTP-binding protein [Desulfobacteraceae bacterium]